MFWENPAMVRSRGTKRAPLPSRPPLLPSRPPIPALPALWQVTFHDTSRMRKRIPLLSDFFGFTCGSLGDKVGGRTPVLPFACSLLSLSGHAFQPALYFFALSSNPCPLPPPPPQGALYASRSSPESQSTVVYRPFESWAPNSDWSLTLPSEPAFLFCLIVPC